MLGVAPIAAEFQVHPHRHHEAHRLTAELRHPLRRLRRAHRAFQSIVHLQQRDDALAPAGPHPEFRVTRGRALDEGVHRLARIGALQLLAVPRMLGVVDAPDGLFTQTRSKAFLPAPARCPGVEMPPRAIVEDEMPLGARLMLAHG